MYPDHFKANMAINNMSGKHILFNIGIIEIYFEFKSLVGNTRCLSTPIHIEIYVS